MYLQHFGLSEFPFSTSDPRFFFPTAQHREALACLLYAIEQRKGLAMLTGEAGTGKTMPCRMAIGRLRSAEQALVAHTTLKPRQFIEAVWTSFDRVAADSERPRTKLALLRSLETFLLGVYEQGRTAVLIVDEAQSLPARVLEEIRLLTNLEASGRRLLQVVLVGQPELRRLVARPLLWQLEQRIAGSTAPEVFSAEAVRAVCEASGGAPRLINILCDLALLEALSRQETTVSGDAMRRVIAEREPLQPSGEASEPEHIGDQAEEPLPSPEGHRPETDRSTDSRLHAVQEMNGSMETGSVAGPHVEKGGSNETPPASGDDVFAEVLATHPPESDTLPPLPTADEHAQDADASEEAFSAPANPERHDVPTPSPHPAAEVGLSVPRDRTEEIAQEDGAQLDTAIPFSGQRVDPPKECLVAPEGSTEPDVDRLDVSEDRGEEAGIVSSAPPSPDAAEDARQPTVSGEPPSTRPENAGLAVFGPPLSRPGGDGEAGADDGWLRRIRGAFVRLAQEPKRRNPSHRPSHRTSGPHEEAPAVPPADGLQSDAKRSDARAPFEGRYWPLGWKAPLPDEVGYAAMDRGHGPALEDVRLALLTYCADMMTKAQIIECLETQIAAARAGGNVPRFDEVALGKRMLSAAQVAALLEFKVVRAPSSQEHVFGLLAVRQGYANAQAVRVCERYQRHILERCAEAPLLPLLMTERRFLTPDEAKDLLKALGLRRRLEGLTHGARPA